MVGGNSLVPHCYWSWSEAYSNSGLLSLHLQEYGEEENGINTRAHSLWLGQARHGEARRRVQAHDMRVNGSTKSDPNPCRLCV
jgi:hypothetical protein